MKFEWTDDTTARFKVLWGEGHTIDVIGKMLGTTRNSVAAKRRRLGLPERGNHLKSKPSIKQKNKNIYSAKSFCGNGKLLTELKNNECKWPIGDPKHKDFKFCGAVKEEQTKPYCVKHNDIAYTQSRPWGRPWRKK